jgi:hypothetical protein
MNCVNRYGQTRKTDPTRYVFFFACGYWTDDYDKVDCDDKDASRCPQCGMLGAYMPYWRWMKKAHAHSTSKEHGYTAFLRESKERCYESVTEYRHVQRDFLEKYQKAAAERRQQSREDEQQVNTGDDSES